MGASKKLSRKKKSKEDKSKFDRVTSAPMKRQRKGKRSPSKAMNLFDPDIVIVSTSKGAQNLEDSSKSAKMSSVSVNQNVRKDKTTSVKDTGLSVACTSRNDNVGIQKPEKLNRKWICQQLSNCDSLKSLDIEELLDGIMAACEHHSEERQMWSEAFECSTKKVSTFWRTVGLSYRRNVPKDPICLGSGPNISKQPSKLGRDISVKFHPVGSDQHNLLAAIFYKTNEIIAKCTLNIEEQKSQLGKNVVNGFMAALKKWPLFSGCPSFDNVLTSPIGEQETRFDEAASTKAGIDLVMSQYSVAPTPLSLLKAKRNARKILIVQENAAREKYFECLKQRTEADEEIEKLVKLCKDEDDALFCYLKTAGTTEQIHEFLKIVIELREGGEISNWKRDMKCVLDLLCESSKKSRVET